MKYIVVLGDGMADKPLDALDGKTCLEAANTPNMDMIAREGICGLAQTIPDGMNPGSDVASLSVLGYNPADVYTGRAPLEAASIGVNLDDDDTAFRCNLVTIKDGKMDDYSAGHISTEEAAVLINDINAKISDKEVSFYSGKSYRHLMVYKKRFDNVRLTPPHDISGQEVINYIPKGEGSELLLGLMQRAFTVLREHPINKEREKRGDKPATDIWLWGEGTKPVIPLFKEKYGLEGSVISAVDLVKGIGIYLGFDVINVPGATGYIDTNYEGKAKYAIEALKNKDFLYLHIEAPDEAGHNGNLEDKVKAIEDIDSKVLSKILNEVSSLGKFRVLLMSDHPTPIEVRTHTSDAVNFAIYGEGIESNGTKAFCEREAGNSGLFFEKGYELMEFFLKNSL
ncbi:MAG: cofactor-independent phosphoglycerate mutase [Candidatus Schekmanbacteria bacterium]|nr:MAG: cofactor-independent phosphoglycerate mutase [Candidatus Schekmanbacteria bacterium]